MERIAAGDRAALLDLYDGVSPVLLAAALRVTGARSDAEEVVQDALLRAWREAASFDRTRGTALAWLVTLVRNRAIDVVRMRGRRLRHEGEAAVVPPDLPARPDLEAVSSRRARAVREAIGALRLEQREVLDLAYFRDLSHSEAAELLGVPLGTVKSRILQSVRLLRELLGPWQSSDDGD